MPTFLSLHDKTSLTSVGAYRCRYPYSLHRPLPCPSRLSFLVTKLQHSGQPRFSQYSLLTPTAQTHTRNRAVTIIEFDVSLESWREAVKAWMWSCQTRLVSLPGRHLDYVHRQPGRILRLGRRQTDDAETQTGITDGSASILRDRTLRPRGHRQGHEKMLSSSA